MLNRAKIAHQMIPADTAKIIKMLSNDIINLVRDGQLGKGLNSKGSVIGRYTYNTEILSGGRKKEGDLFDFQDTGDLYKNFDYDFGSGQLEIFSTDSKVDLLKEKYEQGDGKLFVLSVEHQHKLNYEMIKPFLIKFLKNHLKL